MTAKRSLAVGRKVAVSTRKNSIVSKSCQRGGLGPKMVISVIEDEEVMFVSPCDLQFSDFTNTGSYYL